MKWAGIDSPDDEGETHDKRDSGENYLFKLFVCVPAAIVAIISAKRIDEEIAERGVLDGEENTQIVEEVVNGWFGRYFHKR